MNLISIDIYIDKIKFEIFSIYDDRQNSILQNEIKIPYLFNTRKEFITNIKIIVIIIYNRLRCYVKIN